MKVLNNTPGDPWLAVMSGGPGDDDILGTDGRDYIDGGPGSDIDYMAPSIAADPEARRWWTRTARRGAGPAVADGFWHVSLRCDVRDVLADADVGIRRLTASKRSLSDIFFGEDSP